MTLRACVQDFIGASKLASGLRSVRDTVHEVRDTVYEVRRLVAVRPPKPPAPFVSVLVLGKILVPSGEGISDAAKRSSLGTARELVQSEMLVLNTLVPLRDVQVIVFCDSRLVEVRAIFYGVNLVHVSLGDCPLAFFPAWELGMQVRVDCVLRQRS